MALRPERLVELLEEVRQERLSLRTGSPSDAEIGREKLADLAAHYIPELVHEVQAQTERYATLAQQHQEAVARAEKAESQHHIVCGILSDARAYHEELEDKIAGLAQQLAVVEAGYSERGKQLFKALSVLAGMWNQYCPPPTEKCPYPGHMFMSAGEDTEELLEQWGLLRKDETAVDCDFANEFAEAPEGLLKLEELPAGWALLSVDNSGRCTLTHRPHPDYPQARFLANGCCHEQPRNEKNEAKVMFSALRRLQKLGVVDQIHREPTLEIA